MNSITRVILGLGLVGILCGASACAAAAAPEEDDQGSSSSELTAGELENDGSGGPGAASKKPIEAPNYRIRESILAPGTQNQSPTDPTPWRGTPPKP